MREQESNLFACGFEPRFTTTDDRHSGVYLFRHRIHCFLLIHSMSYCLVKFFLWTLSTSLVLCSNSSNKEDINRSCYNRLSFSHAEIPPRGEGLACSERSHSFVRDYPSMQERILPSAQGGNSKGNASFTLSLR